jgi:hypothetical protein
MARYSAKAGDEVPQKHNDQGPRRTKPADVGCPSVEEFHRIYNDGRIRPFGAAGDGLVDKETRQREVRLQRNQFQEDQHDNSKRGRYDNDTSGWVRAPGEDGTRYPRFDHGKLDPSSKPPKPATGLTATGRDAPKSPFSAAHKTYEGE